MSRTPSIPAPPLDLPDATAALIRIRVRRSQAHDPDLDFYPAAALDDDDVDAAVTYLATHSRVPSGLLADEVPDRALLVAYQHQRDTARYQQRLLAVLNAGHALAVPASAYGRVLGLPTRYAVYKRRTRLLAGRQDQPSPPTAERLQLWLATNHRHLLGVATALTDHRELLLTALDDEGQRDELAQAIDEAGARLSARPSRALASAIAYAMFLLRRASPGRLPDDDEIRAALRDGLRLREEFVAVQAADADR